jgi:hypothetical protein
LSRDPARIVWGAGGLAGVCYITFVLMRIAGLVVIRNGTGRLVIDGFGGLIDREGAIARIVAAGLQSA